MNGQCVSDTGDTVEIEALLPTSGSDTTWKGDGAEAAAQVEREHSELMTREKEFSDAVDAEAPRAELEIRLTQLMEEFQDHFDSEEYLMRSSSFPGLKWHRDEHQQLIEQISVLREGLGSGTISRCNALAQFVRL